MTKSLSEQIKERMDWYATQRYEDGFYPFTQLSKALALVRSIEELDDKE